jgi:hypothetical protein
MLEDDENGSMDRGRLRTGLGVAGSYILSRKQTKD